MLNILFTSLILMGFFMLLASGMLFFFSKKIYAEKKTIPHPVQKTSLTESYDKKNDQNFKKAVYKEAEKKKFRKNSSQQIK